MTMTTLTTTSQCHTVPGTLWHPLWELKNKNRETEVIAASVFSSGWRIILFRAKLSFVPSLEFLKKAKETGFFIRFFYVCTSDPSINVARITQRYLNGGHEVPISKVISRYYKSLLNAEEAIAFVDRAYVYDNSIDDQLPRLLYRTIDGELFKRYTEEIPNWAQTII